MKLVCRVMATLNDLYTRLDDILMREMPSLYKVTGLRSERGAGHAWSLGGSAKIP